MKLLYLLFLVLLVSGCFKSDDISFCEGVSPKGEGVKCGVKFESGELTAVVKSGDPFGTDKLDIQVFRIIDGKNQKSESISVAVKPEEKSVSTNLPLYIGGNYKIIVVKNGEEFIEKNIEIVE